MKTFFTIVLMCFFIMQATFFGQDSTSIDKDYEPKENNWRFIISPYAWLAGQATDVGGEKLRQSFNDLSSLTNFGFQLNAGIMYKDWILTADGTYANLGSQTDEGVLNIDLDIKQYMLDLKLGYLVYSDFSRDDENAVVRGWALEVNAGAKYWKNDVTIDYKIMVGGNPITEGEIKEPQAWWDLMIGLKARIFLSRSVLLGLAANGGGFGIGTSSKLSWDFTYANTFKVSRFVLVTAGYRQFRYNRVDGEGDEQIETTVTAYGPFIGVSFVF